MKAARRRAWSAWGSVATGALAVIALLATLFVAHRALSEAFDVLIHGEADAIVGAIVAEIVEEPDPLNPATLEKVLHAHEEKGLRYIAIAERETSPVGKPIFRSREDAKLLVEVGTPMLRGVHPPSALSIVGADGLGRTGQVKVENGRVRVTGVLVAPVRRMRKMIAIASAAPALPPLPPETKVEVEATLRAGDAGNQDKSAVAIFQHNGPKWLFSPLVIEFEPPVTGRLKQHFLRLILVASIASVILIAFAIAWSRSAMRLAAIEQRAAREQRLVALGSMSSVMAHELRNPLASLKGHAQLLLEDPLEPKQHQKVARVVAEAERLEALTTNLLDFVRDGPIERTEVETRMLVDQALHDLPRERVAVNLDAAPPSLVVDPSRLARAVHNLVDNALGVSGDELVDLTIARRDKEVTIEVRDRGPGIPSGTEQQIFEPFVTTRVRGTGLGLPIAKRIAEQHDGTLIGEAAKTGGGAIFRLTLPLKAT